MDNHRNIQVIFQHKLLDVKIDSGELKFLQTEINTIVEVQADLIIGADGAYSTLRRYMLQKPLFGYNQTYINHGYVELIVTPEFGSLLTPNHLHIWPRQEFMMIALPNRDNSWTVTLFMPYSRFEELNNSHQVLSFFEKTFPDIVPLIGEKQLVEHFFKTKPSTLMYLKCSKFHIGAKALLLGDAAHAMVPFYGQGMNAGFEDCTIFNSILDYCNDDITTALEIYTEKRKNDAHAICDLALYNYIEMRDLVMRPSFRLRKFVDNALFQMFPAYWLPLYNSISFSDMAYEQCIVNKKWQDKLVYSIISMTIIVGLLTIFCAVL